MRRRIGEWVARAKRWRVVRAYSRFSRRRGNRLAGAVTFYSFISLVPVLLLAVAGVSWALGDQGIAELQGLVEENLPGLDLDLAAVRQAAGALTVIGIPSLLLTGLGAVDAVRAAVRSMWNLDDQPGSAVQRKVLDLVALAGLGLIVPLSMLATASLAAGDALLQQIGLGGPVASTLSTVAGYAVAIGTSAVLVGYLLAGMPRIKVPFRVLLPVALVGGLVFELLKQVVARYIGGPAGSNAVAALAAPLAVLAWIYLVARVIMYLAAYTAEWAVDEGEHHTGPTVPPVGFAAIGAGGPTGRSTAGARRSGDPAVGVAVGALGAAAGLGLVVVLVRGGRAVVSALRGG